MFSITSRPWKDTCDGLTRRELLRVGGASLLGLSLANILRVEKAMAGGGQEGSPGLGKAKNVILIYLQGGPSHLDLWDPKDNVPDNVKSIFKPIATKLPGVQFTEILPKLAQVNDKFTMIRSMSYTPDRPVQSHGGHLPDDDRLHGRQGQPVGPAGAASRRRTSPTIGCNIVKFKPPTGRCCRSS